MIKKKKKQEIGLKIVCTKSFSSFDIEWSTINLYLLTWSTHSAMQSLALWLSHVDGGYQIYILVL